VSKPKWGPYEFMISYDRKTHKLTFIVNGQKNVWDLSDREQSEKELPVAKSAKKSEVTERTLAERKYCAIDQFYYSEMFTCPICYGADRERERVLQIIEDYRHKPSLTFNNLISLIKGEQK